MTSLQPQRRWGRKIDLKSKIQLGLFTGETELPDLAGQQPQKFLLLGLTRLRPGDVIATGTPGGVGFARQPPVWLEPGDIIEVAVDGLGAIRNRVVAEDADLSDWRWRPPGSTAVGI